MRNACRFTLVAAALLVLGCGSSTPTTQPAARDQASVAACNYYARCSMVGAGLKYETADSCLTQVKASFDTAWPAAQCKTISSMGINNCITAINIASCGNAADTWDVLFNKCTKANVCTDGSDE